MTVVLVAGDYPARGDRGTPIEGIAEAEATGALVFHAGTALNDGRLVTNGGRLLGVTATGRRSPLRGHAAYAAADLIRIPGARRREDIALADRADAGEGGFSQRAAFPWGTPSHHPLSILSSEQATVGDESVPTSRQLRAPDRRPPEAASRMTA